MIELFTFKYGEDYGSLRLLSRYSYVRDIGHVFGYSIDDKKDSLYLQFTVMNSSTYIELPKKWRQKRSDYNKYNKFLGECINYFVMEEREEEDNSELIITKKMWGTFDEAVKDFHRERYGK